VRLGLPPSPKIDPTTAQKECQIAVQFFRHAYRKELIERNSFEGVTVGHGCLLVIDPAVQLTSQGWDFFITR
jgi:hypothetical protein